MNKKRPVNLDLTTLKYPPMAIVSILHRITGVLLFLLMPFMLFILGQSVHSAEGFAQVNRSLMSFGYKLTLWVFASAFAYHLFAGIRHMIMDLNIGEELNASRYSAVFILVFSTISTLLLGIWLW